MGSGDDMFRIWSGPGGSSHKEPLPGTRIHRGHAALFSCAGMAEGLRRKGPKAAPLTELRPSRSGCLSLQSVYHGIAIAGGPSDIV